MSKSFLIRIVVAIAVVALTLMAASAGAGGKKGPKAHQVHLTPACSANPLHAHAKPGDLVTFRNLGTVTDTVRFDRWPFREPQADIMVAPGSNAGPYTVVDELATYAYHVLGCTGPGARAETAPDLIVAGSRAQGKKAY